MVCDDYEYTASFTWHIFAACAPFLVNQDAIPPKSTSGNPILASEFAKFQSSNQNSWICADFGVIFHFIVLGGSRRSAFGLGWRRRLVGVILEGFPTTPRGGFLIWAHLSDLRQFKINIYLIREFSFPKAKGVVNFERIIHLMTCMWRRHCCGGVNRGTRKIGVHLSE